MPSGFVNNTERLAVGDELRDFFVNKRTLGLLGLIALIVGLFGPFGTYTHFSPVERYLYWAAIVAVTAPVGQISVLVAGHYVQRLKWPSLAGRALISSLSAVPVSLAVLLMGVGFGFSPSVEAAYQLLVQCAVILFGIASLIHVAPAPTRAALAAQPPLLERLPGAMRGRLIRIAAQDHYVEVVTDKGSALLAMRFRDAITAAAPEAGAQIHRSHWVALSAVSSRRTQNGRPVVVLTDGSELPVSRSFRANLKALGLG